MRDCELAAWVRLTLIPGLTSRGQRKLLSAFGLPPNIFAASRSAIAKHVGEALADLVLQHSCDRDIEKALAWCNLPGNRVITLAEEAYPKQLLQTYDPPALLYVKGAPELLARTSIAIVGSRNASAQGCANAESFGNALSAAGFTVVSGLALGIDAAAHLGALRSPASTIGVLGTGLDVIYPMRNSELFSAIAEKGALISEFPLGTPAIASNFPRRNRIISGLAQGVLVVEAALYSGSLITARLASEQSRDVFAIPGSIHSPLSKGCHALIKQGAKLVETPQDVMDELRGFSTPISDNSSSVTNEEEPLLLQVLGHDPCNVDMLSLRSGLTPETVSAMLLQLELEGKVASLPGGRYQRLIRRS